MKPLLFAAYMSVRPCAVTPWSDFKRWSRAVLALALLLFVSSEAFAYECPQSPSPAKTEAYQGFLGRVHELNGQQLPYRLFVPKNYDETKSYPLVLFLHHAGLAGTDSHNESGWDNCVQLTSEIGSGGYGGVFTHSAVDKDGKSFDTQERYPHFVLAPHANSPAYGFGGGVAGSATAAEHPTRPLLMGILEQVQKEFNIDPARLYVTGISMGCYGTWDLIMRNPGLFAAASPQSCRGDPNKELLAPLKDMPIWSMCGTNDSYFSGAQAMADGMKAVGATAFEFTAMQGVGHSIGNRGYDYPGFIDWMFEQRLAGAQPPGSGGAGGAGGAAGGSGVAGTAGNGGAPSGQAGQAMGGAAVAGGGASATAGMANDGNASGQGGAATPPGVTPPSREVVATDSSCALGRSSGATSPFAFIVALMLGAAARRRRERFAPRRARG
jgi:dienelactone hydrolase